MTGNADCSERPRTLRKFCVARAGARRTNLALRWTACGLAMCAPFATLRSQNVTPTDPVGEALLPFFGLPVLPWRSDREKVGRLLANQGLGPNTVGATALSTQIVGRQALVTFNFSRGDLELVGVNIAWANADSVTRGLAVFNRITTLVDSALKQSHSSLYGRLTPIRAFPADTAEHVLVTWGSQRGPRRTLTVRPDGTVTLALEVGFRSMTRAMIEDTRHEMMQFGGSDDVPSANDRTLLDRTTCDENVPRVTATVALVSVSSSGHVTDVHLSYTNGAEVSHDRQSSELSAVNTWLKTCLIVPAVSDGKRVRNTFSFSIADQP